MRLSAIAHYNAAATPWLHIDLVSDQTQFLYLTAAVILAGYPLVPLDL